MRALPVTDAFNHALKSTFRNLGFAFYASWPWMLAILPFNIVGNVYVILNRAENPQKFVPGILIVSLLIGLLTIVAFASIAVNWHRYVLLDQVPLGWQRLRLDGIVWRYIGNIFLIVLIFAVGEIAFGLIAALSVLILRTAALVILVPLVIGLIFAFLSYGYRLGCKLPGIAVGRDNISFGEVLDSTQGNFWRFVGLGLLNFVVLIGLGVVVFLMTFVASRSSGEALLSIVVAVQFFVNWVASIFGVTMLTSLYGYFIEGREF